PVPSHMEDYDDVMRGLAASKPLWDAYTEASQDLPLVGLWPAAHPRLMANRQVRDCNWFKHDPAYNIEQPNHLSDIGLPLTTDPRSACVTVLSGRIAEGFDDSELRKMLAGGGPMMVPAGNDVMHTSSK
ncbi:MAG: hypothetical protein NTV22_12445, partial [bacterium]|nr:hypothetical protein [bacterium]